MTGRRFNLQSPNLRLIACILALLWFVFMCSVLSVPAQILPLVDRPDVRASESHAQEYSIEGFVNIDLSDQERPGCALRRIETHLTITPSIYLEADLLEIARSISHPLLDLNYAAFPKEYTIETIVKKAWNGMAGSSIWLPTYQAYLMITRIFFYDQGVKQWPIASWFRGQLFDEQWNEQINRTIRWQSNEIKFPRTFDIPFPYILGDAFFGPEDPRIILEQGVEDAEPLILFNMIFEIHNQSRGMHIYRPFSSFVTYLHVEGKPLVSMEKNWAPLFVPTEPGESRRKYPDSTIYFLYDNLPRVVRCHTLNGACTEYFTAPDYDQAALQMVHGGTTFEPIPKHLLPAHKQQENLHTYVGFPRSRIASAGCYDPEAPTEYRPFYRPHIQILSTDGIEFWFEYMSLPLDLGIAGLTPAQAENPCGNDNRIIIANSITRFENDEFVITFSVGDSTVQVATIGGLSQLLGQLPEFGSHMQIDDKNWLESIYNSAGVLGCAVTTAEQNAMNAGLAAGVNMSVIGNITGPW